MDYIDYTTAYKYARKEVAGLTRDEAAEKLCIPSDRLDKIENNRIKNLHPEEVVQMADCYGCPELRNYYCTHDCEIGLKENIPETKSKELAQIAVETLTSLSRLDRDKDRLLEIVEDGEITDDEMEDFMTIKATMEKIAKSVDSLQLWIEKAEAMGKMKTGYENTP